ncbi:sigma 54-interacting transcriptional regulator [Sedimentibacter sp. zth1]|uniref:sigma-54 interaction domain-containing protein n=1 Tax=Sedimentibacter sp. zth1 TaxID=2816908 RepID=UPI001A939C26|nr:sigma 54-interacting transcriptional regulator [Sedimentibacter sp. zth1]QSX05241.1 sigma 54-interacting transcriptional regulator [Sedimentibacter sp. zth1]
MDRKDIRIINQLEEQIKYLTKQQYIYNEMLNKVEDGIYITDKIGTTLFVNDAFLALSGLSRDKIIGKTVYSLKNKSILPNSCCAKVIETRSTVFTINNYVEGQKCLVSGSPIFDDDGKLVRTIAVIRDVSELNNLMKNLILREDLIINSSKYTVKESKESKKDAYISSNDYMKEIYNNVNKVANFDSTILILGETGVGKDFLAEYIYNVSNIKNKGKFVKVNCGAVPENLLESEFFGYEEGAFSGALKGGKKGLFEEANNGVIFLDEIGDMPYSLQVKLLTVINDKVFYRIGGVKPINFNAKIVAATNANLLKLVEQKKFRLDLYYRLNVVNFTIPPLRNRKEDIIPLSQEFIEYYNNKYSKNTFFSPGCLEKFLAYDWPGNIREMKNIIERLVLISDTPCIHTKLFKEQLIIGENETPVIFIERPEESSGTLKERMEQFERKEIIKVLNSSRTLKIAAETLDIDISTLVRKKQKYKIK